MSRVAAGDRAAFSELMTEHQDRVFAVCLRTMGEREAALDATQDTFVTLWRKAAQYEGTAAVGTWLYRIAVNSCYDQLRRRKRRPTEPLSEVEPADPRAGDPFEAADERPALERALRSIPDEFRLAVVLTDVEGLSIAEASEVLGVPPGTVKSRVFRGRRRLAEILGNPEGAGARPRDDHHA
jgi:RNA polymerase sigma-70 factor, ECF subfamily